MSRVRRETLRSVALLSALLLAGCGGDDRPPGPVAPDDVPNRPPAINSLRPDLSTLDLFVDDTILFVVNAVDPEDDPVSVAFYLDGQKVSDTFFWSYLITAPGPASVLVEASDGVNTTTHEWSIQRRVADADPLQVLSIVPADSGGYHDLTWRAGADLEANPLVRYEIRSSDVPIVQESTWTLATTHGQVTGGVAPGEEMTATLFALPPGNEVFVTVRGVDAFGHYTILGNSVSIVPVGMKLHGRVLDAHTGDPLEGVSVRFNQHSTTTAADGSYGLVELDITTSMLIVEDEFGPEVGGYFDYERLYATEPEDTINIYLLPNIPITTTRYADFRSLFLGLGRWPSVPREFDTRRFVPPIDIHIEPFSNGGLDYRQEILGVIDEVELALGIDFFTVVDQVPAVGVYIVFGEPSRDNFVLEDHTEAWFPILGRITMRTLYTAASVGLFQINARHELGHALGLDHSLDRFHLMVGGQAPLVNYFTADERLVLETLYQIPQGVGTRFAVVD